MRRLEVLLYEFKAGLNAYLGALPARSPAFDRLPT